MAKKHETKAEPVETKQQFADDSANLFAYTETAYGGHYPGYASLNRHADGSHWLTVRTSGGNSTAAVCLPESELKQLAAALAKI